MSGADHYREAERLLDECASDFTRRYLSESDRRRMIARAHVHALLAFVPAENNPLLLAAAGSAEPT